MQATQVSNEALFSSTYGYAEEWGHHVHMIPSPYNDPEPHTLRDEVVKLINILREARHAEVMLLDSSGGRIYPEVLATILIGFMPKRGRPSIALVGDMWQPNTGLRHLIERVVVSLADRATDRYFVLSSEELKGMPALWGIDDSKTRLVLYHYSFSDEDLAAPAPPQADHIFAGGNANRDYRPLVEAARQMPDREFILATRKLDQIVDPPPNVTAGPVPHEEFVRLMRSAAAVVLPIRNDLVRSSGQQTYLNAMYLKKPTIVSQVYGVRDHITDREDGVIVDGSVESYVEALNWVLNPANAEAVGAMCEAGHVTARDRFSREVYAQRILELMQELERDRREGNL